MSQSNYVTHRIAQMYKVCDQLTADLCRDLGPSTDTCKMVEQQTKSFQVERCEMMRSKYAEVLADLRRMEAANKPLPLEQQQALLAGSPPVFGSPDRPRFVTTAVDGQASIWPSTLHESPHMICQTCTGWPRNRQRGWRPPWESAEVRASNL
jgi:hypothetical protein